MKIALITPKYKNDYMTNTVLDGLFTLGSVNECRFSSDYVVPSSYVGWKLDEAEFLDFARSADLVLFFWGKGNTDYELAEKVGRFDKTVFIDGSEVGKNNRFDKKIMAEVLAGTYSGLGAIDKDMLKKCVLYFRREKPYNIQADVSGKKIIQLPFGIETRYLAYYKPEKVKDIDFTCIFGQEEYPVLRRDVRKALEKFCKKNGFTCATKKTKTSDEFYEILSRTRVGISVGGGGFDTARFWEILGNNCVLMTERIDIFEDPKVSLPYKRIHEFVDLGTFEAKLEEVASFLRKGYDYPSMTEEYEKLISEHSSVARVKTVLNHAKLRNL